jgi:hypothetical protein
MIYNASGTKAPFDDDSGAWLIRVFADFARSLPPHQHDRVTIGLWEILQDSLKTFVVTDDDVATANTRQ